MRKLCQTTTLRIEIMILKCEWSSFYFIWPYHIILNIIHFLRANDDEITGNATYQCYIKGNMLWKTKTKNKYWSKKMWLLLLFTSKAIWKLGINCYKRWKNFFDLLLQIYTSVWEYNFIIFIWILGR